MQRAAARAAHFVWYRSAPVISAARAASRPASAAEHDRLPAVEHDRLPAAEHASQAAVARVPQVAAAHAQAAAAARARRAAAARHNWRRRRVYNWRRRCMNGRRRRSRRGRMNDLRLRRRSTGRSSSATHRRNSRRGALQAFSAAALEPARLARSPAPGHLDAGSLALPCAAVHRLAPAAVAAAA